VPLINRDINPCAAKDFVGLLDLKAKGLDPLEISDRAIERGHAAGYTGANRKAWVDRSRVTNDLSFPPSLERISFDGIDWHHLRESRCSCYAMIAKGREGTP
jgi:hypothetical protein